MTALIIALIVVFAGLTGFVLVKGIITMAQGKDNIGGRQSNKLMSYRVALQLVTILLVIVMLLMARSNGS